VNPVIEAIRDWYQADHRDGQLPASERFYHARVGTLLGEVDRLTAERDKLLAELDRHVLGLERDAITAERDRYRAALTHADRRSAALTTDHNLLVARCDQLEAALAELVDITKEILATDHLTSRQARFDATLDAARRVLGR